MNTLLIYMVKVAIYLAAFYLVYSLMLSRDTTYSRNRAFILLSVTAALIFPSITFETGRQLNIQLFGKLLSDVFIIAGHNGPSRSDAGLSTARLFQIIYSIYIIGVIALLFKLVINLLNLLFLIARQKNNGSNIIRFHGFNTSGFSAMGNIFINTRLSTIEAREIIRHEQNHLRKNHFLDILFIELVIAFQWFNPIVYFMNRALRAIHEFQADQDCLSSGVPVTDYQSLLLSQVFESKAFNLTNSFSNPSLVKKRMIMMTKKRTASIAGMKALFVLPVTALVFLAISAYKEIPDSHDQTMIPLTSPVTPEISTTKNEEPFVQVDEMPLFPGGDAELLKYIGNNTNYPEKAKQQNIQGRVIIRFCVTAKGGVSQISVLKGVDPELDAEAVRVVETLPAFKPGREDGKNVPVWYMVPITFSLK